MNTVWLIGSQGATVISLSSILAELGCHVVYAHALPAPEDSPELIVMEFRPHSGAPAHDLSTLPAGVQVPLILVGPELPNHRLAAVLGHSGARAYLNCGLRAAELRESLRGHLPQPEVVALTVGQLRISLPERLARYGHRPLALTTTQFRLLCLLMQRPGHHFHCSTLETLAQCRGVPAHVASLRRTLAAHSAAFLLRGTPHQGYAIDARRQPRTPSVSFALKNHLGHLL